jgi:hypothetical protein
VTAAATTATEACGAGRKSGRRQAAVLAHLDVQDLTGSDRQVGVHGGARTAE